MSPRCVAAHRKSVTTDYYNFFIRNIAMLRKQSYNRLSNPR